MKNYKAIWGLMVRSGDNTPKTSLDNVDENDEPPSNKPSLDLLPEFLWHFLHDYRDVYESCTV